jgi:hypothetical protein
MAPLNLHYDAGQADSAGVSWGRSWPWASVGGRVARSGLGARGGEAGTALGAGRRGGSVPGRGAWALLRRRVPECRVGLGDAAGAQAAAWHGHRVLLLGVGASWRRAVKQREERERPNGARA